MTIDHDIIKNMKNSYIDLNSRYNNVKFNLMDCLIRIIDNKIKTIQPIGWNDLCIKYPNELIAS